jgi:hypothetical protein
LGLTHDQFWDLTPDEFEELCIGHGVRRKRQLEDLVYLAWHTAKFNRAKNIPDLQTILNSKPKAKKQTDEQMMAMARLLNAAFGGVEVTV